MLKKTLMYGFRKRGLACDLCIVRMWWELTSCLQAEIFSDLLVITGVSEVKDAVTSQVHLKTNKGRTCKIDFLFISLHILYLQCLVRSDQSGSESLSVFHLQQQRHRCAWDEHERLSRAPSHSKTKQQAGCNLWKCPRHQTNWNLKPQTQ